MQEFQNIDLKPLSSGTVAFPLRVFGWHIWECYAGRLPCCRNDCAVERVLFCRYCGHNVLRDLLTLLDRIDKDPDYCEGMDEFDDMRDVEETALTGPEIRQLTLLIQGHYARRAQPVKSAIWATGDLALDRPANTSWSLPELRVCASWSHVRSTTHWIFWGSLTAALQSRSSACLSAATSPRGAALSV
ncbi:MAG: hypothetical protein AAFR68_01160 [Pseudomonadota bacterium]